MSLLPEALQAVFRIPLGNFLSCPHSQSPSRQFLGFLNPSPSPDSFRIPSGTSRSPNRAGEAGPLWGSEHSQHPWSQGIAPWLSHPCPQSDSDNLQVTLGTELVTLCSSGGQVRRIPIFLEESKELRGLGSAESKISVLSATQKSAFPQKIKFPSELARKTNKLKNQLGSISSSLRIPEHSLSHQWGWRMGVKFLQDYTRSWWDGERTDLTSVDVETKSPKQKKKSIKSWKQEWCLILQSSHRELLGCPCPAEFPGKSWEGWLCMNSNSAKSWNIWEHTQFPIYSLFIPYLFPAAGICWFVGSKRGLDKHLHVFLWKNFPFWNILTATLRGVWKSWKFFPALCACGIFGKSQNSSWEHSELVHISLGIPFLRQIPLPNNKSREKNPTLSLPESLIRTNCHQ